MNFDLTDKEQSLVQAVEALCSDDSLPDFDTAGDSPDVTEAALRPWLTRLGEAGYLQAGVGDPAGLLGRLAAQKSLAQKSARLAVCADAAGRLLAELVTRHGTDDQKKGLAGIFKGEQIGAVALAEPASGGTPTELDTVAENDGDGFRLSGQKRLVSLAPLADRFGIFAQLDDGLALFLVDRGTGGLTVGEPLATLGHETLHPAPVELKDVFVPENAVIRPPADDPTALTATFRHTEDWNQLGAGLGLMARCVAETQRIAAEPRAHAKPPAGYQLVRFGQAEMLTLLQTAELAAYRAADLTAQGDPEADVVALCAKAFAADAACRVSEMALQISATAGYLAPNPFEQAFRDARLGPITGHTVEVARMAIADAILAKE